MSIASRAQLVRDLGSVVGHYVSADMIDDVMAEISEKIGRYSIDLDETPTGSDSETEDLLKAFLSAKEVEGRSVKTIRRYDYICRKALDKMGVPLRDVSVFHLRKYLADEKARGISDSTLDGNRECLSSLFGWLHKEGLLKTNPTANLGSIKVQKKVRKPYSQSDIEKLKEHCKSSRDKAIICLLMSTGCRIGEVCGLNRDALDFTNKEVTVLGKGNKERTVFLDDVTVMVLSRYLSERKDEDPALFTGKATDRLTPGGVRFMLRNLAEKAGVENAHPHRFRRTLASNLIDHGMDIQNVAQILGHERLDTTMKYIYTSKGELKNQYRKYA